MDWLLADDYWTGRLLFQRLLAVVYLVAFVSTANQFRALLGSDGMTPIPHWLARVPFRRSPTIFAWHYSDRFFAAVAWTGAAVASALLLGLGDALPTWGSMVLWLLLWVLYLSIVNVGQVWYGFGWESLLCEVGFVAVFLGSDDVAPPWLVLIALRWLLFRLEFGAGMIKIRGDSAWRDLTALYYHHETQPMPGPLSWWFHHLPRPLHRIEVLANHVTQLGVPFLLFLPAPVSTAAAVVMVVTQLWLVISGNFAWLNWLTIVIALSVIPDSAWEATVGWSARPDGAAAIGAPAWVHALVIAFAALTLVLSWWPARNLVAKRQLMNASFNPLRLVGAYGAFGSMTRRRFEVVIEGTEDDPASGDARWHEYDFKGKPGDPSRRPRQFAPYHLRLDWLMWFLALDPYRHESWFLPLVTRLVRADRDTLRLLRHDPFAGRPPRAVRATLYRYRYTSWQQRRSTGLWWQREPVGEILPPVTG